MPKTKARVITGWRQVIPPKRRSPRTRFAPVPKARATAPRPAAPAAPAEQRWEAEGGQVIESP